MNILFFTARVEGGLAYLDEEESRHVATVLRRKVGDPLDLTDGKGHWWACEIVEIAKRHLVARVLETRTVPPDTARLHLAVAPTKSLDRFEWLLEKTVEIGVHSITPLLCRHSERTNVRLDRLEKVVLSAMKQCLRTHLPLLNPMTPFKQAIERLSEPQRYIGWCPPDANMPHLKTVLEAGSDTVVFIGPEGDFSPEEIALAQGNDCLPISLGSARLRTETAGVYACSVFNLAQVFR